MVESIYTSKYKFTNEQLSELLDAQESLNIKYTGEDWRDAIPLSSFLTALDTEVAEYLESSPRVGDNEKIKNNGWKWWKQNLESDEQNQAIETIDVLHFGLSLLMYLESKENILKINDKLTDRDFELDDIQGKPISLLLKSKSKLVLRSFENDTVEVFCNLYELLLVMATNCNRNLEEIYQGYFKKNALNAKRVEGGYIQGEYKKIDENGNEDNRNLEV